MANDRYAKLTVTLSVVAAVLALTAAILRYVRTGEVSIGLLAAGVFVLVLGFGAWTRRR